MTNKVLSHNFSNSLSSTKEVIELQLLFLNISNSFAKIVSSNKPLELRPGKEVNIILPANDLEIFKKFTSKIHENFENSINYLFVINFEFKIVNNILVYL